MKVCRNHPDVEAVSGTRCRPCYNEYMRVYCLDRYHRIRNEAIEMLGGKCVDCGVNENLEFDHQDRNTKAVNIAKLLGYSAVRRKDELHKCVLRCSPCHKIKTRRMKDYSGVRHGEGLIGRKGCFCEKCKPLKDAYENGLQKKQKAAEASLQAVRVKRIESVTTCACGGTKDRKALICLSCRNLAKQESTSYYPPLEELIVLVKEHGYVAAGKKVGVSDNALRKHLRRNGVLPLKKSELSMPS